MNSLWSLKSLDNIVISDEEIIEDSSFGAFAPLQSSFFIKSSCSLTKVQADLNFVSFVSLFSLVDSYILLPIRITQT